MLMVCVCVCVYHTVFDIQNDNLYLFLFATAANQMWRKFQLRKKLLVKLTDT